MSRRRTILLFSSVFLWVSFLYGQTVVTIEVDGAINPSAAAFIQRGIEKAKARNAECLVIYLNTPGGNKVVNKAFIIYMEGKNVRGY